MDPHGEGRGLPVRRSSRRGSEGGPTVAARQREARRREGLSLRTSLLLGLAYVVLLAIVALGVPLALNLEARVSSEVRSQAESQADVVAATAADLLEPGRRAALRSVVDAAARSVRGRVLVVSSSGVVLADSATPSHAGEDYASRPEIASALKGVKFQAQRTSKTLGEQILATAVPILHDGKPIGAVRITQSVAAVSSAIRRVEIGLGIVALVVLAIGLTFGAFIAREISRPLLRLERVAKRVAAGELDARAEVEGSREQRSLSSSFNEMADRIVRLLGAQREFVSDASHELRTPLTGLRLRLEEARAAGMSEAAARELDAGVAEVDRLAEIVNELLLLGRAGEREQPATAVKLDDVVCDAIDRWSGSAQERAISLSFGERSGGAAWCAKADVDRALDALIENALLYSTEGSEVSVASLPGRIEVADRGPGLAAGEEETVFERFHRGRASRATKGSGLGLPIARELARAWGGDVTLVSRRGGGAIATLSLPERVGGAEGADGRASASADEGVRR